MNQWRMLSRCTERRLVPVRRAIGCEADRGTGGELSSTQADSKLGAAAPTVVESPYEELTLGRTKRTNVYRRRFREEDSVRLSDLDGQATG